jgi:hypothetical protein
MLVVAKMLQIHHRYMYLCPPPSDHQVTEYVLWHYEALWDKYEAARPGLPRGALTEIPFQTLAARPLEALEKVTVRMTRAIGSE